MQLLGIWSRVSYKVQQRIGITEQVEKSRKKGDINGDNKQDM
jgi:hypothetical protein